jgi:hypothetical protein
MVGEAPRLAWPAVAVAVGNRAKADRARPKTVDGSSPRRRQSNERCGPCARAPKRQPIRASPLKSQTPALSSQPSDADSRQGEPPRQPSSRITCRPERCGHRAISRTSASISPATPTLSPAPQHVKARLRSPKRSVSQHSRFPDRRRSRPTSGLTIASLAGQAASGGDRVDVPLDLDAVAGARMKAAKPPSCAWMVNQRAGRSLSLRNEWATCGGAATNPPEETVIVSASRPELEGQFALEHVEGIGVLGRARPV